MGKRSSFDRNERDYYPTPYEAVLPLAYHNKPKLFCEPCAGNGVLIDHLSNMGYICTSSYDIEPLREDITKKDFSELSKDDLNGAKSIITNPPWNRKILHPMIHKFVDIADEVWLLFDSDWKETLQSIEIGKSYCTDYVPIGRVKWIPDSKYSGKDNAAWYRFSKYKNSETVFHWRKKNVKSRV